MSEEARTVFDGRGAARVYDRNIIRDHETVTVRTRRGLELCGSNNHRVLLADRLTWRRLDELAAGDRIAVSGGGDMWPAEQLRIHWIAAVSGDAGRRRGRLRACPAATVMRHRAGDRRARVGAIAAAHRRVRAAGQSRDAVCRSTGGRRSASRSSVDEKLGAFLGYLVGDGHISRKKRHLGLTTGDESQALEFHRLGKELFDVTASMAKDEGRWRVLLHSEHLSDFLVEFFGMTTRAERAREAIPDAILRSPEPVVRAFLRAYFDCDGYAGKQGVILSTMSDELAEQIQLLLLNYGILSRRRRQTDGCWHVHVDGRVGGALRRAHRLRARAQAEGARGVRRRPPLVQGGELGGRGGLARARARRRLRHLGRGDASLRGGRLHQPQLLLALEDPDGEGAAQRPRSSTTPMHARACWRPRRGG